MLVKHFRNSAIMEENDAFRPKLFDAQGREEAWPGLCPPQSPTLCQGLTCSDGKLATTLRKRLARTSTRPRSDSSLRSGTSSSRRPSSERATRSLARAFSPALLTVYCTVSLVSMYASLTKRLSLRSKSET